MESLPNVVNGWHVYRLLFLETMSLRSSIRKAGVDCSLDLLVDGISVEFSYSSAIGHRDQQLIDHLIDQIDRYMRREYGVKWVRIVNNGRREYVWRVDCWDIQWEELK